MPPRHHTVPPALRPIVLLARMRETLPPKQLTGLLATLASPADPTAPEWIDLCSALDAYDQAAQLGRSTEEARRQVDTAAMIFHLRYDSDDPQPGSDLPEHHAARWTPAHPANHHETALPPAT